MGNAGGSCDLGLCLPLRDYYAVRAYRTILLHSDLPRFEDLAISALYGIGVFVVGGLFFRYMKRGFADVL